MNINRMGTVSVGSFPWHVILRVFAMVYFNGNSVKEKPRRHEDISAVELHNQGKLSIESKRRMLLIPNCLSVAE